MHIISMYIFIMQSETARTYITAHEQWLWSYRLARHIAASRWKPDTIVGLYRGGIFPAIVIEDYFASIGDKTIHFPLCCCSYAEDKAESASTDVIVHDIPSYALQSIGNWKNVLIVDDICDTGKTIIAVKKKLLSICQSTLDVRSACLIWKRDVLGQVAQPTWWSKEAQANEWIIFPHEFCEVDLSIKLKHECSLS